MTPRTRRAMTVQFMPQDAVFNGIPNIRPPDMLARLSVGDPLDDESFNPLLWSR